MLIVNEQWGKDSDSAGWAFVFRVRDVDPNDVVLRQDVLAHICGRSGGWRLPGLAHLGSCVQMRKHRVAGLLGFRKAVERRTADLDRPFALIEGTPRCHVTGAAGE